jgi:hypothetical protein
MEQAGMGLADRSFFVGFYALARGLSDQRQHKCPATGAGLPLALRATADC